MGHAFFQSAEPIADVTHIGPQFSDIPLKVLDACLQLRHPSFQA